MNDSGPPHLVAGEFETLRAFYDFQRNSFVRKVSGVTDEAAARSLLPSDTTLLWLVNHLAFVEEYWFCHCFAGQEFVVPDYERGPMAVSLRGYALARQRADAILDDATDLNAECVQVGSGEIVNLRWVLGHMLEEVARHAGHADIIRELLDGETGR
ncbi:MAG: DinB family protein [Acidimicrobiales bacterium]